MGADQYVVDTNISLEVLLSDSRAGECRRFISTAAPVSLLLTQSSLDSIGLKLTRRAAPGMLGTFCRDLEAAGTTRVATLALLDLPDVEPVMQQYRLDFDDAYQYVVAERFDATIVSFDADFDRTPRGRKTPGQVTP